MKVVTVFVVFFFTAAAAVAEQQCSEQTLQGSFAFSQSGTAAGLPAASVGVVNFDGAGNLSGISFRTRNGVFSSGPFSGTYSVAPDCTEAATAGPSHPAGVIVRQGREVRWVRADPGFVITGIDKRIEIEGHCSNAVLDGSYGFNQLGTVIGVGPTAAAGVIEFDGAGQLTGRDTLNHNNVIKTRSFFGSYSVNSDCTLSATLFYDGVSRKIVGALANSGREMVFMDVDAGIVQSGVAVQQGVNHPRLGGHSRDDSSLR